MKKTRALLAAGALAAPLFITAVVVQDYTRPGFDPRRHPLSLLSLGDLGWIQITNFVLVGLLNLAFAVGLRRALRGQPAGTWGPLLVGAYGVGLIGAGVFVFEPAFGFPPGAPESLPAHPGWRYTMHGLSALVVFGSLTAACFVFTRAFGNGRDRWWALYSAVTGVAVPTLWLLGGALADGGRGDPRPLSLLLRASMVLGWGWASLLAVKIMKQPEPSRSR